MVISRIIMKDIVIFKKNCKYSKTISNRLVSLIDLYDLLVIDQYLQHSISVIDVSLIEFDKSYYIYKKI